MLRITMLLAGVLLFLHPISVLAKAKKITLKTAISRKLVDVKAFGRGTTGKDALHLQLTSTTEDTIIVETESGLLFKPDDESRQPLVTLGGDVIAMVPHQNVDVNVSAFCGNSSARCPANGGGYSYLKPLDTTLAGILRYVRKNEIPLDLAQKVVWMFTNGHPLNSVYSPSLPVESQAFAAYVAKKLKQDMPLHFINYRIDNSGYGAMARTDDVKAYVNMAWKTGQGYRNMHVSIYKADGTMYKRVEGGVVTDKLGSAVVVELYSKRDPAGAYKVRLHDDANNTIDEKIVSIGR